MPGGIPKHNKLFTGAAAANAIDYVLLMWWWWWWESGFLIESYREILPISAFNVQVPSLLCPLSSSVTLSIVIILPSLPSEEYTHAKTKPDHLPVGTYWYHST